MPEQDDETLQALYAQRWADPAIGTALDHIVPGDRLRRLVSRRMADSILRVHALIPDRWGISDGVDFVRLNVGRAEAMCIDNYGVLLMVHEPTVARVGRGTVLDDLDHTAKGAYLSIPDSVYVTIPWHNEPSDITRYLERLREAHEAHLAIAVKTGMNGMTRKGHHPGLLDMIAATAGIKLPQPTYVRVSPPTATTTAEETPSQGGPRSGVEGGRHEVTLSRVERNPRLRHDCIEEYGTRCQCCDTDLGEVYGPVAVGLIHVHHLHPASQGVRETDPIRDLRPVCANCHMVIHAVGELRSVEEVSAMFKAHGMRGRA